MPALVTLANGDMQLEGSQIPALPFPELVPVPNIAGSETLLAIQLTAQGFPILPFIDFDTSTKDKMEGLLREYVGRHYSRCPDIMIITGLIRVELASARFSDHIPFTTVKRAMATFIHIDHVPPGFVLIDPHNLKKCDIIAFFKHAINRQSLYGPEKAFGFLAYQRNKTTHCATYPTVVAQSTSPVGATLLAMASSAAPVITGAMSDAGDIQRSAACGERVPATVIDLALWAMSIKHTSTASPAIVVPSTAGMIQVHQHEMTTLIERGLHPVVPVNGPNDSPNGQPIYVVPAQPFLGQDAEPT